MWEDNENILKNKIKNKIIEILKKEVKFEKKNLNENELSNIVISLNPKIEVMNSGKEIATLVKNGIEESRNHLLSNRLPEYTIRAISEISRTWENIRKEKCQICDLLPTQIEDENEKLCSSCSILRDVGRHKTRGENIEKQRQGGIPESIWLDEIKDENNMLAFIVGKITPLEKWLEKKGYVEKSTFVDHENRTPKNLSASRARAIWRTIEEFAEESSKIINTEAYGCAWKVKAISKELGRRLCKNPNVSILFEGKTVEGYIYAHELELETVNALGEALARSLLRERTIEISHEGDIFELGVEGEDLKHFYTSRAIYSHAGEFALIVPAKEAIGGIMHIRNKFDKSFNKVFGRLSLNLGITYFKHKTPLYIALDSGKRMLDNFNELSSRRIDVEVHKKDTNKENVRLKLNIGEKEIEWLICTKLPDGQDDFYYPYFIKGDSEAKHISEISQNEIISIHPSFFDFEFLDTTTRRFDIILENGKRPHRIFGNGPRPYYLEEINNFERLWDIFSGKNEKKKRITSSQLHNFHTLLITKIEEWNLRNLDDLKNDTFGKFVEDSIVNILEIQKRSKKDEELTDFEIIKQSILSGLFFDVFELHMTIMKQKPEGEENERQG